MKITEKRIKQVAKNLVELLDEEKVHSAEDLEKLLGKRIFVRGSQLDYVEVAFRPSNFGTSALTISYTAPYVEGIPLEIRINSSLNYSQIILKMRRKIEGYSIFERDLYGNMAQNKLIQSANWQDVIKEITKLKD